MQDKITIADAPDCLNTNDKAMWVLGYQAALAARSTCLHQIQVPSAADQAAWHAGLDAGRAQAAPAAVAVPDGWKLVPVDLTPEMKREFMDLLMDGIDIYVNRRDQIEIQTDAPRRIWKAVLALSPAAPHAQADAQDADGLYYLQDARWSAMVGNCPSFWRLGGGYTTSLDDAERFTLEAAMKQHKCRETDLPWLCSELDTLSRPTIDCQYMPRSWDDQRDTIATQAAQQADET
ncbi:hypothetical protein [Comamonas thiooxydans]|uniref:hypothetical protein n=1 Tax=Comamonas thiooxydans TaxID=363952 RepID=UPI0006910107|nr:hypothetical protein [Comamonas thiooxydans]